MESRSEYLRQLRMTGRPLPQMADPLWLTKVAAKDDGFLAIPDLHITDLGKAYSIRPVIWGAIGVVTLLTILLIWLGLYHAEDWDQAPWTVLWCTVATIGVALLANMARVCHPRFMRRLPEISHYPLVPGKAAVVLIPQVPNRPVESAKLVLREYMKSGAAATLFGWDEEVLWSIDLSLDGDGNRLRTMVELPKSVLPSYETYDYKIQWLLVVTRTPTLLNREPERYLLWVPHQLVTPGPTATVRLPGGRP